MASDIQADSQPTSSSTTDAQAVKVSRPERLVQLGYKPDRIPKTLPEDITDRVRARPLGVRYVLSDGKAGLEAGGCRSSS